MNQDEQVRHLALKATRVIFHVIQIQKLHIAGRQQALEDVVDDIVRTHAGQKKPAGL
jgi:hypothetical protein